MASGECKVQGCDIVLPMGFQTVVPAPEVLALSRNLLEMQVLEPHPSLTESEILEVETSNLCLRDNYYSLLSEEALVQCVF